MKPKDIRELSIAEIETKLRETRETLLQSNLRKHTGQIDKPHTFKAYRKDIARLEKEAKAAEEHVRTVRQTVEKESDAGSVTEGLAETVKSARDGAKKDAGQLLKETQAAMLEVAVNEAVNNAFRHGSIGRVSLKMRVINGRLLVMRVRDDGPGFDVSRILARLEKHDCFSVAAHASNPLPESGRGLFLMQAIADKVRFNQQGNEILLAKKLY